MVRGGGGILTRWLSTSGPVRRVTCVVTLIGPVYLLPYSVCTWWWWFFLFRRCYCFRLLHLNLLLSQSGPSIVRVPLNVESRVYSTLRTIPASVSVL